MFAIRQNLVNLVSQVQFVVIISSINSIQPWTSFSYIPVCFISQQGIVALYPQTSTSNLFVISIINQVRLLSFMHPILICMKSTDIQIIQAIYFLISIVFLIRTFIQTVHSYFHSTLRPTFNISHSVFNPFKVLFLWILNYVLFCNQTMVISIIRTLVQII